MTSRRFDTSGDVVQKPKDRDVARSRGQRHERPSEQGEGGGESMALEQMHHQFQVEIEQSEELDDPLEVYVRYVTWITKAYSTGMPLTAVGSSQHHHNISRESGLFALLEKAIRAFENEKQYKNDARYVRLNIMYIQMIKDPLPMFKFMMTNSIGSELATFYEEYATFLEHAGDGRRALEIMRIGIEREARPLQRLRRKLEELQHRLQQMTESSEASGSSSGRIRRVSDGQQHNQRFIPDPMSESTTASLPLNSSVGTRATTKLAIYADPQAEISSQGSTSSHVTEQGGVDRFPVTVGASGRKERLMVDLVGVYSGGELQLDELRARLARYSKPAAAAPQPPEMPVRPPSRSLFSSNTSHVLSTRMTSSRENTLDFSVRIKSEISTLQQQDPQGEHHDRARTPPPPPPPSLPVRYPAESDLIPQTPPQQVRHVFGTTLVPRIELTPGESRKRSLSRNFVTSSPTLHSKSAYAEMNKIFSDRSRMSQGSVHWSDDYYQEEEDDDDHTITRTRFSAFVASSESEHDLDEEERGEGSTMTREIQAMKRLRANEAGDHTDIFDRRSSQMSFGSQSRTSTSDITRAIEARGGGGGLVLSQESRSRSLLGKSVGGLDHQQQQHHQQQQGQQQQQQQQGQQQQQQQQSWRSSFPGGVDDAPFRSSLSTTSSSTAFPSLSWTKKPNSFTLAAVAAAAASNTSSSSFPSSQPSVMKKKPPRPKMFEVFRDEPAHDTPDLAESSEVPALGDEEPPSQLDVHSEDDLRDLSWQEAGAEGSDHGDDFGSQQQYLLKRTQVQDHEAPTDRLKAATTTSSSAMPVSGVRRPFGSSSSRSNSSSTTGLFPRSTSSSSLGSILRSVSSPFSGPTLNKGGGGRGTSIPTTAAMHPHHHPSPPRIQELQSLFSPSKSNPTFAPTAPVAQPPPPPPAPASPKDGDWTASAGTRLSTSRLSGGKTVQMQRLMFPNPCFPGSQRVRSTILGRLMPGLKAYAGYHEDLELIMEHHLKVERAAKRAERQRLSSKHGGNSSSSNGNSNNSRSNSSSSNGSNGGSNGNGGAGGRGGYQLGWSSTSTDSEAAVQLGQESYTILMKVGEGGYAKVYGIEAKAEREEEEEEEDEGNSSRQGLPPQPLLSSGGSLSIKAAGSNSATTTSTHPKQKQKQRQLQQQQQQQRQQQRMQALKLERPGNPWEFYILSQIHKRFQASGLLRIRSSVVQPISFYRFKDESYLIMEYCAYGTLLDAINVCRKKATTATMATTSAAATAAATTMMMTSGGTAIDESLALFFTIELLRVLEGLHVKGIIHGDLKADNCMLRFDHHDRAGGATTTGGGDFYSTSTITSSSSSSSVGPPLTSSGPTTLVTAGLQTPYEANGGAGWSRCGIRLIDFGRAVDVTAFEQRDMTFRADWPVDAQDCPEIRNETSWRFQPDYFGLAKIVFTMLTGLEDMPTTTMTMTDALPGGGDLFGGGGGGGHNTSANTSPVFDERRYRVSEKDPPGSFVFVVPAATDDDSGRTTTTTTTTRRRQRLDYTLRRYWKVDLWRPLFDILLNPSLYRPADRPWEPCTAALGQVRAWMQQHLSRQRVDEPRGVRRLLAQLEFLLVEHQKARPGARRNSTK
ncbi:hypothetical protein DFQ26_006560 [Actinomortierella ambigua]|nr:hypothetical protein DFQ26_006560 [Actinomortierella ambigua]